MYDAKRGRRGVATYTAERDPYSADRLGLLAELRRAIERDELVLHYQPKVCLAPARSTGVEALVRWQHPTRGLLGPDAFIPLAERTGAVADLTRWVVDRALASSGLARRRLDLPVAVNLAAAQHRRRHAARPRSARLLAAHGVPRRPARAARSPSTR